MRKLLVTSLLLSLFTTGCFGTIDAIAKLKTAGEEFVAAKSLTADMTMKMVVLDEEGNEVETSVKMMLETNTETKTSKLNMSIDAGIMAFDITSYAKQEGDILTTYTQNPFGEGYIKSTDSEMDFNPEGYGNLILNALNIKEVDSDEEGVLAYIITIEPEDAEEILSSFDEFSDSEYTFEKPLEIKYTIKDGNLYEMSFDLTSYLTEEQKEDIKSASLYMKFTNINNTNVVIPESVINSAVSE